AQAAAANESDDDDEAVRQEFFDRGLLSLDDLQDQLRLIESGGDGEAALAEWRRTIHTIKGESGMLALDQVNCVCTAVEELLEQPQAVAQLPHLYAVLDWFRACFDGRGITDVPDPAPLLATLQGARQEVMPRTPPPQAASGQFVLRAEGAMLAEFVNEATEHLENAEVQLLELDTNPANAEAIHSLFRSFHTIKGLAGFMELAPLQELAHHSETFLDRCRDHTVTSGAVDLVFAAIDGMKRLVAALREALEQGHGSMVIDGQLTELTQRLHAAMDDTSLYADAADDGDGATEGKSAAQSRSPGPKLGEILCQSGVTDEATIERVLQQQRAKGEGTGPRLGELLVREHVVPAREVSSALRQQRSATVVRESVKVDAQRLDRLVDAIGELVIAESMVSQDNQVQQLARLGSEFNQRLNLLSKITRELQEIATSLRMVPIKSTFQRMARLARDVAGRTGKEVDFRSRGDDTELDKNVVDRIGDPLVHMVRNAIDHGLEPDAAARRAAGKDPRGVIELAAFHQGGTICIQIRDDGRGLNRQRICVKAQERGLISAQEAHEMSDGDIYRLIFHPGFSTAESVSDLSGRGVGMDVVKKSIAELRGQVDIDSTPGKGSTFTIRLPLTLAIIDGMVCRVGTERYIIPTLAITRSLRPRPEQLASAMGNGEMLNLHGEVMPIFRLHKLLNVADAQGDPTRALLVVIDGEDRKTALMVDELLGKQQIVIKSLGQGLRPVQGIAGGAIMADGSVGLIADPQALIALAHGVPQALAV
ncbi:MAG: hypothetical protein EA402_06180, partial [Planctomycetota bacterium]